MSHTSPHYRLQMVSHHRQTGSSVAFLVACLLVSLALHLLTALLTELYPVSETPLLPVQRVEARLHVLALEEKVDPEALEPETPELAEPQANRERAMADPGQDFLKSKQEEKSEQNRVSDAQSSLNAGTAAYYPDAYVRQGIEGEVLLRVFVDAVKRRVLDIQVEKPSRHALFNEAARQAASAFLQNLPANTPAEVLLPVRFRLDR